MKRITIVLMMAVAVIAIAGCKRETSVEIPNPTISHEFVDLGLPSGTLWATYNVGALRPEETGHLLSWGEILPKEVYDWPNYRYGDIINDSFVMYKYHPLDSLTILEPTDDAATAYWGTEWRMPTREEWDELYLKTEFIWTTLNGVEGRLLTGLNGNSIFLPTTGYRMDNGHYSLGNGVYWSSNVNTNYVERGISYHFDSNESHVCETYERNRGQAIRAVRATNKK